MPKNIIIFSDGTGQRGGVNFDEVRTNIYKLYRATRCGPDSNIDPALQLTYYDPGLGTAPEGTGFFGSMYRKAHNLISQATGMGITLNIVDCYTEIMRIYEKDDRIFLFGFSRGAYTVRCLAAVLGFCGIPTQMKDGSSLSKDNKTLRKIAREAVHEVYQHVGSPKDEKYVEQRKALALRFRQNYKSGDQEGSNADPYFIGVFDTVASIASKASLALLAIAAAISIAAISFLLERYVGGFSFVSWIKGLTALTALVTVIWYLSKHVKYARGLSGYTFWQTVHLTAPQMQFYNKQLSTRVGYARHAISIDEHRKDFDRVPWGGWGVEMPMRADGKFLWFKQLWFAGNHADIGGGYPENESRLSDICLEWMLDEATKIPDGMLVDRSVLHIFPSHKGMQHDETKSGIFSHAAKIDRKLVKEATLHTSVLERFKEVEVLQADLTLPYRPEGLREHVKVASLYGAEAGKIVV
jgi:uncharacterized protein (DUF2235 family)